MSERKLLDGIEAVIFDFDGTLYEAKSFEKEIVKNLPFQIKKLLALKSVNVQFRGKIFNSAAELRKEYFECLGKKMKISVDEAESWYSKIFLTKVLEIVGRKYLLRKNLNSVYSVLKHKKIKIAVLGDYSIVKAEMDALGMYEKLADEVFYPQKVCGFKPAPEVFLKIAETLEAEPSKILVIGNENYRDGEGARLSGMNFVQIKNKDTKETAGSVNHPLITWEEFTKEIGI